MSVKTGEDHIELFQMEIDGVCTDLMLFSSHHCDLILLNLSVPMQRLNYRPRKTRGYKTAHELFLGQPVDLLAA